MTWFYRVFRNPVVFLTVLWTRMRRIGRENIPAEGGAVLVCNHLSMWDMITVACMTRRYVCFVGKSELEKNPLVRFFVRQVKAICVDRGKPDLGAIRRMLAMVKQGELLLIFPEGTRNRHPESQPLLPLQEGTAMVALRGGVPAIPLWICGKYNPWRGLRVAVGKPIDLDEFRQERRPNLELATKRIEEALLSLREETMGS